MKEVVDIALVGEMKKNFAEALDDFLNRYSSFTSDNRGISQKKYTEDCSKRENV